MKKTILAYLAVVLSLAVAFLFFGLLYNFAVQFDSVTKNGLILVGVLASLLVFVGTLRWVVTGNPFTPIAPPPDKKG